MARSRAIPHVYWFPRSNFPFYGLRPPGNTSPTTTTSATSLLSPTDSTSATPIAPPVPFTMSLAISSLSIVVPTTPSSASPVTNNTINSSTTVPAKSTTTPSSSSQRISPIPTLASTLHITSVPTSTLATTSTSASTSPPVPTPNPARTSQTHKPAIIAAVAVAALVILILIVGILWCFRRRKRNATESILHPFRDEANSEPPGTAKSYDRLTSTQTCTPPNSADIRPNQILSSAYLRISRGDRAVEEPRPSPLTPGELQLQSELQMMRVEIGELQEMMGTPVPPYSQGV